MRREEKTVEEEKRGKLVFVEQSVARTSAKRTLVREGSVSPD